MGQRHRHAALPILVLLILILGVTPVAAWNTGPPHRDSNDHYYYLVSLESYTTTAANWGKDGIEDGGSVTSYADPSCATQTDVCVYDADYTGSAWATVYGKSNCVNYVNSTLCDQFRIRYDTSNLSGYSLTYLRRAGCHEFGHTLRLEHYESYFDGAYSCMYSSINNALQSSYYSHDKTRF